jgi:hypothetical protein
MALIERKIEGDKITCLFKSANVLLTEYQLSKQILDVTFRTGFKYRYYHVNPQDHAGLQIAESTGQYFHKVIRTHAFEKMGAVPITEMLRRADKII